MVLAYMGLDDRMYKIKDKSFPSVTTATSLYPKPFLNFWYGKYGNEYCQKIFRDSQLIGSTLHTYIQEYFRDSRVKPTIQLSDELSKTVFNCIRNFDKFAELYNPTSLLAEELVYSMKYEYAGTLDRVLSIDSRIVLVDWKSSNHLGFDYEMQIEAYYRALTEMITDGIIKLDGKIKDLWIVRLGKEGEFNPKRKTDLLKLKPNKDTFNEFLGYLNVLKLKQKREKKKNAKSK